MVDGITAVLVFPGGMRGKQRILGTVSKNRVDWVRLSQLIVLPRGELVKCEFIVLLGWSLGPVSPGHGYVDELGVDSVVGIKGLVR